MNTGLPPCANDGGPSGAKGSAFLFAAERPNWYHQWTEGWATEVFWDYGEFNMQGGGATLHSLGGNYVLCDGEGTVLDEAVGWDVDDVRRIAKRAGLDEPDLSGLPAHRPGCGARNVDPAFVQKLRVRRFSGRGMARR